MAGLLLVVLGAIALLFIWLAPIVIPIFTGDTFTKELDALTVGLSRVLFPIIVLLGSTASPSGILNAYDQFTIPAIAPLGLEPRDHRRGSSC
jgi:putative peptidoglycan lipid II flippase